MHPLRIHFTYRTVDRPHGGANNFLRALCTALSVDPSFELVDDFDASYDILFMNQLSSGPGDGSRIIPLRRIRERLARAPQLTSLVVRAINLRRVSHGRTIAGYLPNWHFDRSVIKLLKSADMIIYQSGYQRRLFEGAGVDNLKSVQIHNGASPVFDIDVRPTLAPSEALSLVATSMSPRLAKGQAWLVRAAAIPGVRVRYFGSWPSNLAPGAVVLEGVRDHLALAEAFRKAHALVHPSVNDVCPNVVVEALHAGLPVAYHPGPGGAAELVDGAGFALNLEHPEQSIQRLRDTYAALVARAKANRQTHSISRACAEYKMAISTLADDR